MDYLSLLPEECVTEILTRTSPRDACRSSSLSPGLKTIADSDAVWMKFLPSDHAEIISRAKTPVQFDSYKELYFRLANQPLVLDQGTISFGIDKDSGKKCYMLGARELQITWGDTPDYWEWEPITGSRFCEVAILHIVWWFEIMCKFRTKIFSPDTAYSAFLVFKLDEEDYGFDSHGFDSQPINVSLNFPDEVGDGETMNTIYLIHTPDEPMPEREGEMPKERNGEEWFEVELGEFFVKPGENRQVEIRIFEVEEGGSKSGLIIEGIEFRPKVSAYKEE